ncbi:SpoIIE family protein phosphatase [Bacteriovoracaceae bacterium]|nr:SpoIIE family protein phosphatase [Bacteriovoracaceae bacterium]
MKLKNKLLLSILILILLSLGSLSYFFYKTLISDKITYLLEVNQNTSKQLVSDLNGQIQQSMDMAKVILNSEQNPYVNQHKTQFYLSLPKNYSFKYYEIQDKNLNLISSHPIQNNSLRNLNYQQINNLFLKEHDVKEEENRIASSFTFKKDKTIVNVYFYDQGGRYILHLSKLSPSVIKSEQSFSGLSINLYNQNSQSITPLLGQNLKITAKDINKLKHFSTQKEKIKGKSYYLTSTPYPNGRLIILTFFKESIIFDAFSSILIKVLGIIILIAAFGVFSSTILAKSFLAPIYEIIDHTDKIARGQLDLRINLKRNDELKILENSVNSMSEKLILYLESVKEKASIDKEIEITGQIQQKFFHQNQKLTFPSLEAYGSYFPASKCGGDWWAARRIDEHKSLIMIGDATGHGLPAAFVTATIHCFFILYKELETLKKEKYSNPASIMAFLNQVIHTLGGDILLTFFIGIFDERDKSLKYCNASHNFPIVYNQETEKTKQLKFLDDSFNPRLGESKQSKYSSTDVTLSPGDSILFYTDGITEGRNANDQEFGERRLGKILIENKLNDVQTVATNVYDSALVFYNGIIPDDDITLLSVQVKS